MSGKCSKTDKVVKREICSIQTKGTKRLSFIDGDTTDCSSQFLLALCEKVAAAVITDCAVSCGGMTAQVMRRPSITARTGGSGKD